MGEAVRCAHEICEVAKNEFIEAVEVVDREVTSEVAVYRADCSKN
jgi:hypothetical protein